jgi:acetoin utilization deacetylase AcuC-like enzyme
MKLIFSPKCLEYGSPLHPENPSRLRRAYNFLKNKHEFLEPKEARDGDLYKVHSNEWVERVKKGEIHDPDTPAYENVYQYAKLSVGGAISAAREKAFSLMRPPGHHVGRNGIALGALTLGFCYFNNLAIAVRVLKKKTLILDIDTHHGNGTQEIFYRDPKVRFISLHTGGIYPGTGLQSEGNCYNYPLPFEASDELYLKALDRALKEVDLGEVEVIAISAGFDTLKGDLGGLSLSLDCYKQIGKRIASLGLPLFAVLEGGYTKQLGACIDNFIQGLEA